MRPTHTLLIVVLGSTSLVAVGATASAQQRQAAPQPTVATASASAANADTTTAPTTVADIVGPDQEETPQALPAPDTTVSPINRPLLGTGLVLFGGPYIASVIVASQSSRPADQNNLYTPVVGPWLNLANRGCDVRPCSGESGNQALLILDGIGQGLGALAIVTSFFIPEKSSRHWYVIGDRRFHAMPTSVGTGYGVLATGEL